MILQDRIPYDVLSGATLPGISPLALSDWLHADEAYAAQMAERARLLAEREADVLRMSPEAEAPAQELLELALHHAPGGFRRRGDTVTCPDGRNVTLGGRTALHDLNALFQEDFCLLHRAEDEAEHVLKAACLCFPASWRLAEKIGRPLLAIHAPVADYDATLARRVQRLFDGVQPGRPLWRFNALSYVDPTLHQPRSETSPRPAVTPGTARYLRSERQCIIRLPRSRWVVFSIHTYVIRHPGQA